MFGYDAFKNFFDSLDDGAKKRILGEMFDLENISVYSIEKRENDEIIFRIYAGNVFYQYIFTYQDNLKEGYVIVNKQDRMVLTRVYMGKNAVNDFMDGVLNSV